MNEIIVSEILSQLFSASRVLIMTHLRPDGDALGSSFGLLTFLRHHGIDAELLLPDGMPRRFRRMCQQSENISPADAFDLYVSLDCANPERLGTTPDLPIEKLRSCNFISIDHHRGNSIDAPISLLCPEIASASELIADMIIFSGKGFTPECATYLLTGMKTDTGNFSFANTTAETFRTAAVLLENGADIDRITNEIFFNKPLNQLLFEAELTVNCIRTACGGKFAYAFIPDELMEKHNFDLREDEGLIDILRGIEGTVIAMLCHRRSDGFRISLRSKDRSFPVAPLARKYGGGGHEMAAGLTLDMPDFAEVEKFMICEISALLDQ